MATVTVIGQDKAGVIAKICTFLFQSGGNIEELDQHVTHGLFTMQLEVSWPAASHSEATMKAGLLQIGQELGMDVLFRPHVGPQLRRIGLLVTKEEHAPRAVLEGCRSRRLQAEVSVILSNHGDLSHLGTEFGVPFVHIDDRDKAAHEEGLLAELARHEVDLVVLARYMRILSPNVVWRYPNRIVNIHPSLLPAFPGALPYRQAFQKGVRVAGVTAHLVTMDLDQGPILAQDAFAIAPDDDLAAVVRKGKALESKALVDGLSMLLSGQLVVGWGRTWVASGPSGRTLPLPSPT